MYSMTVEELIEDLQKVENKNLPVITEGCDCYGDVGFIVDTPGSVELRRPTDA